MPHLSVTTMMFYSPWPSPASSGGIRQIAVKKMRYATRVKSLFGVEWRAQKKKASSLADLCNLVMLVVASGAYSRWCDQQKPVFTTTVRALRRNRTASA